MPSQIVSVLLMLLVKCYLRLERLPCEQWCHVQECYWRIGQHLWVFDEWRHLMMPLPWLVRVSVVIRYWQARFFWVVRNDIRKAEVHLNVTCNSIRVFASSDNLNDFAFSCSSRMSTAVTREAMHILFCSPRDLTHCTYRGRLLETGWREGFVICVNGAGVLKFWSVCGLGR